MRVLRLDLSAGSVDLHPFMSVARGLAPEVRAELVSVLAGIPSGHAPVGGLIEAHGVLLDLTDENLALLDLDTPLPVVVTAADLPGAPAPETSGRIEARAEVRAAEQALAEAEAALGLIEASFEAAQQAVASARGDEVVAAADGLAARRATVAAAETARGEAERAEQQAVAALAASEQLVLEAELEANAAREARAAVTPKISVAAAALDAAADRRDPVAMAAVETARARVIAAEAALAAARAQPEGQRRDDDDPAAGAHGDDAVGLDVLRAERLEVEAAVLALETPDPLPVRLALEQISVGAPVELVTPPEAIVLADHWAAITAELDALEGAGAHANQGQRRAEAVKQIRAAEEAVEAAEVGDRRGLEPAAVRRLDAAHAQVLAARDATDRRLGGRQARRRLDDAVAAEQAVLDQLGFVTYAEFLMGATGNQDVVRDPNRLRVARAELAAAHAAMRALDDGVAGDLRKAELLAQRRALRAAAVDLLGSDPRDDVDGALRRHRVPAEGSGGAGRLAHALEAAGLVVGEEDLPERFLVDIAKVWLDEQDLVMTQQRVLQARVAELDLRIADRQRVRAEPVPSDRPVLAEAVAALEDAKEALRNAEARASRHARSEAEVEERRLAFEAAVKEDAGAVVAVGQAEATVDRVDEARRRAAQNLEAAQARLVSAAEAAAQLADVLLTVETQVAAAANNDLDELEVEATRWGAELADARAQVAELARLTGEARATLAVLDAQDDASGTTLSDEQAQAAVEDSEWYLLARLAAQRAASYCGSVPLVLDDALAGLDTASVREILDRLERMAATVQVVVVSEDLPAAAWASRLGPERAAVVEVG